MASEDFTEPVTVPITDVLDLHTFLPREVPDLIDAYLTACMDEGISRVRIIHGKGLGILKKRVAHILEKHPLVAAWAQAPAQAGGWGAVIVDLKIGK